MEAEDSEEISSESVVEKARMARIARARQRLETRSAIVMQSVVRVLLARRARVKFERDDYDAKMKDIRTVRELLKQKSHPFFGSCKYSLVTASPNRLYSGTWR